MLKVTVLTFRIGIEIRKSYMVKNEFTATC